jgi:hypothetical protein
MLSPPSQARGEGGKFPKVSSKCRQTFSKEFNFLDVVGARIKIKDETRANISLSADHYLVRRRIVKG